MNEEFYNRHYITTRPDGAVIDAWSDGLHPEKDTTDAICVNKQGGYQFRLTVSYGFPDGYDGEFPVLRTTEENPPIYDMDGVPLYKYSGVRGVVLPRTDEEIEAERAAIPAPPPSAQEQLRADVDFIAAMTGVSL